MKVKDLLFVKTWVLLYKMKVFFIRESTKSQVSSYLIGQDYVSTKNKMKNSFENLMRTLL